MADNTLTVRVSGYTVYDLMSSVLGAAEPDTVQANTTEYVELLNNIRGKISEEHASTLNRIITNPQAHNELMPIILNYVTDYVNNTNDVTININRTAERIYQDMAGFGVLTPYLNDPLVEEININAWNSIQVMWSDHELLLTETFSSPQECVDIIRKMVRIGGVHIDYSQPIIDSYIGDGTRISATLPPVNAEHIGASASIRKQTYKNVTKEKYLDMGFATEKAWDFIEMSIMHNVSVGLAGSPGAGKTTLMTCMLRRFLDNKKIGNNRIFIIEEAREIDLTKTEAVNPAGGHPRMLSPVLQNNTTQGENPVTARQLIRHALRFDPQIIVPAEMRGEEAIEAVEAGLTGVQIVSSFHAWGAKDGYVRIQSMCQMGHSNTSESALLQMIIRAFPIMVYIKKDDDGVRRIHEIFEATGVEENRVVGNTICRFVRTRVIENEEGRIIRIYGKFVQYNSISKELRRLLIQNGAKRDAVDRYYFERPEDNPDHPEQYDEGNVAVETMITAEQGGETTEQTSVFTPPQPEPDARERNSACPHFDVAESDPAKSEEDAPAREDGTEPPKSPAECAPFEEREGGDAQIEAEDGDIGHDSSESTDCDTHMNKDTEGSDACQNNEGGIKAPVTEPNDREPAPAAEPASAPAEKGREDRQTAPEYQNSQPRPGGFWGGISRRRDGS